MYAKWNRVWKAADCQLDRHWHRDNRDARCQSASEHGNCLFFHSCIKSIFNPLILRGPCVPHSLLCEHFHVCKPAVIHFGSNKWFGLSFAYAGIVHNEIQFCAVRKWERRLQFSYWMSSLCCVHMWYACEYIARGIRRTANPTQQLTLPIATSLYQMAKTQYMNNAK